MPDQSAWLIPGFIRAVAALGVSDQAAATVEAQRLLALWSNPARLFHNEKHLANIVSSLDEQSANIHEPEVLVAAAWYHGAATYDPETRVLARLFNYAAAADQAINALTSLGATGPAAARVGEVILMLADLQAPADDLDGCVFVSAVMSYLGVVPQKYRTIQKLLREEIPSLDDHLYYRQRRAYIRNLLERDELFRSPTAREYEQRARQNLTGELAKLDALFPQDEVVRSGNRLEHKSSPVFRAKSMRPVVRKSIISAEASVTGNSEPAQHLTSAPTSGSLPVVPTSGSLPVVSPPVSTSSTEELSTRNNRREETQSPLHEPEEGFVSAEDDQSSLESVGDVLSTLTMKKINYPPATPAYGISEADKGLLVPNTNLNTRPATKVFGQIPEELEDDNDRPKKDKSGPNTAEIPLSVDEEDAQ